MSDIIGDVDDMLMSRQLYTSASTLRHFPGDFSTDCCATEVALEDLVPARVLAGADLDHDEQVHILERASALAALLPTATAARVRHSIGMLCGLKGPFEVAWQTPKNASC